MDEDDDFDDEMMLMLALELALDESEDSIRSDPRVARVLELTNASGERFFYAIYASPSPSLFRDHFRMTKDSFNMLLNYCLEYLPPGIRDAREALAVTLDWLGAAPSCRKQEIYFNLSYGAVHKYRMLGFKAILLGLRSHMKLPTTVPVKFKHNTRISTKRCAIDGAHFPIMVSASDTEKFRNRKGWVSTNVLVASDWDMRVCYAFAGAEGSAHDSTVLQWSEFVAAIPNNCFVLADAGYALTEKVLTPFRSVRYHLQEWGVRENGRPQNAKELFNLRHAKVRNIVERLIGMLKRRFRILRKTMECELTTCKSAIYACMHNFIRTVDRRDLAEGLEGTDQDANADDGGARDADVDLEGDEAEPLSQRE